jgi:phosphatidylinositol alpha 1,6-mannosyltransferase
VEVEAVLSPRVAFFPDSFLEVNGVARTSAALEAFARARGLPFLTVHAGPDLRDDTSQQGGRLQLPRSRASLTLEADLSCDLLVWRHARRVRRALCLFRPDVVHITGPNDMSQIGAWTAWRLGVPIVASWHTNVHEFAARRVAHLVSRLPAAVQARLVEQVGRRVLDLAALYYRSARIILAPSAELVDTLEHRTGRPGRLMRRGLDAETFSPRWRTAADRVFRLGYVGRLSPEKNVRLLRDVERALLSRHAGPFRFVIVGFGSERDWLAQNLEHVELPGLLTGAALSRAYADMDVFLFPSTTDTFGNVVLEALASGTPAIVTSSGGPRTIVEDGTSGLVADDASGFAEAITLLMNDPARLAAMRAAARARALQFSWPRIFEGVYDAYGEALRMGTLQTREAAAR